LIAIIFLKFTGVVLQILGGGFLVFHLQPFLVSVFSMSFFRKKWKFVNAIVRSGGNHNTKRLAAGVSSVRMRTTPGGVVCDFWHKLC
jgi:hypothetical protein